MSLKTGDHIVAKRRGSWLAAGMMHHGIYLGDGTVIHFTGMIAKDARIIRTNIRAFCSTDSIFCADYSAYKPHMYDSYRYRTEFNEYFNAPELPVSETLELCFKYLGEKNGNYHAGSNNCEHFATFMKKKIPFSLQSLKFGTAGDTSPMGPGIGIYLIELFRFKLNPILTKKEEYEYMGTFYETSRFFYYERYTEPYHIPPIFLIREKNQESWSKIDQREVEYPLKEIKHCYRNRNTGKIIHVPHEN